MCRYESQRLATSCGTACFWIHIALLAIVVSPLKSLAQTDKNDAPIAYDSSEFRDPVAKLIRRLENGQATIEWDDQFGWLPSLLKRLEIPRASQTLVFSKTSQQLRKIGPRSPRAIYFSDDVYVGYVQRGDFIEIAAVDPVQGAAFYQLDQASSPRATIVQSSNQCMSCHETGKTMGVPGFLIRSVFPKKSGHPDFKFGTTTTDHTTPLEHRFGGWYVTGEHGAMRHRGNVFVESGGLDREAGANVKKLPQIARPESHLEPTSDIVALMLLEHQTQFHNHVAKASYDTRQALHRDQQMNKLFERAPDYRSDSTKRIIESAAQKLVEYAFFSEEFQLTSPITGNANFTQQFARNARRTKDGRSLKDLDLNQRLLKYPCSYLVYTESFNSLPNEILEMVKSKMLDVLSGKNQSDSFAHLSNRDKENIFQILTETHPLFRPESH